MKQYWTADPLWPESLFVIVAGGPSLTLAQVEACRGRQWNGSKVRVIAVNDAYRIAPFADVLYFCDDKWWKWHADKLKAWPGLIVRLAGGFHDFGDPRIKVLKNGSDEGNRDVGGLAESRDALRTGRNSGFQAINLAVHLGARKIALLGYDMQGVVEGRKVKTHWFGDHPGGTSPSVYNVMLPYFETLVKPLAERGIEIVNCTPGSRIGCFRRGEIGAELGEREAAAA